MFDKIIKASPIIAGVAGIILAKVYYHSDYYKDSMRDPATGYVVYKAGLMKNMNISTTLNSGKLNLVVENKSALSITDLFIKCIFNAPNGVVLAEENYTINKVFYKKITREINDFVITDIPRQTDTVSCEPKNFRLISKEEEKKYIKGKLDEAFKDFTRP